MKHKLFQSPRLVLGIFLLLFLSGCEKELDIKDNDLQPATNTDLAKDATRQSSKVATDWYNLQAEIMLQTTPQPSPVATGRFFSYEGIALYEAVRHGIPNSVSLSNLLYQMPPMPAKEKNNGYSWPIAANAAMAQMTRLMLPIPTPGALDTKINDFEAAQYAGLNPNMNSQVFRRSQKYGVEVANAVFEWSRSDGNSRNTEGYTPPVFPGAWVPTPPLFALAGLPHMGEYRPFLEVHRTGVVPPFPHPYSEEVGSPFYNEVLFTYEASENATEEQKAIATFWHNTGPGTYTTPGHHFKILTAILEDKDTDLGTAAMAYAKAGIATRDAFIMTWRSKYFYNLLRPVTYIQKLIQPGWLPLIGTPNYPEYPAAHTIVTAAFMEVMKGLFTDQYAYTDKTYEFKGIVRSYNSFSEAVTEAGWSRIYAGIHYRPAVVEGEKLGKEIGSHVNLLQLQQ
jgi:hypothetical protein